ncbi:MAG: GNAT family N-acetyltransferase [Deltaproteobacteria bacterium]|nr:GNAT family N-acetyltransferase [Deltaproteobacteria bacterium]
MEARRLGMENYDALVALWAEAGLPVKLRGRDAREAIERQLKLPHIAFLGLFDGDLLVGAAIATHDGRKGWVNHLAVRASHRRRGLGRTLVRACEQWLDAEGIRIFACLVEAGSDASRALFGTLGYALFEGVTYHTKRLDPGA